MKENIISRFGMLILGFGLGAASIKMFQKKKDEASPISSVRFEVGFNIFSNWLKIKNEGRTLEKYFEDNEIGTVAIYGVGALGERLFEELKNTEIKVMYAIDRIADSKRIEGLKIVGADDELEDVDAIIVTPVQDFYLIEEKLEQKTDSDILSLEDIVNYCM